MTTIRSSFSTNLDGWTTSGGGSLSFDATGGNSGGALKGADSASNVLWYFEAPDKFEGDLLDFFGGTLSFDMRRSAGAAIDDTDVVIVGANGTTLVLDTATPGVAWGGYSLALDATTGWRVGTLGGALATNEQIQAVLEDVTRIAVRGEYVSGSDKAWLDNFALTSTGETDVDLAESIVSTFESSLEGWTAIADVASINRPTTGGNEGGYMRVVDAATGELWFYSAPEQYLGDKSDFYGGSFSYDLKTIGPIEINERELVVSGGGLTLVLDFATAPSAAWTHYSVTLDTSGGWKVGTGAGPAATEAQIRQLLASMDELLIRGEFTSGDDEGGLDNVVLAKPGATGQVWQLFDGGAMTGLYTDLADALAAASAGDSLVFLNPVGDPVASQLQLVSDENLTIRADAPYDDTLGLAKGIVTLTLDGTNDMTVRGNAGGNAITGGDGDNDLLGLGGADTLSGGLGKDVIKGGDGADVIVGGRGKDKLSGDTGADTFRFLGGVESRPGAGADVIKDFSLAEEDRIDLSALDPGVLAYIGSAGFSGGGAHQVRVEPAGGDQMVQADLDGDGAADFELVIQNGGIVDSDDFVL